MYNAFIHITCYDKNAIHSAIKRALRKKISLLSPLKNFKLLILCMLSIGVGGCMYVSFVDAKPYTRFCLEIFLRNLRAAVGAA